MSEYSCHWGYNRIEDSTLQRDKNLRDLSSEHHQALGLAREIKNVGQDKAAIHALIARVAKVFKEELLPHFEVEEQAILPELQKAGETILVERTIADHVELKRLVAALDEQGNLQKFSECLKAHVRFEERELFEVCQRALDCETLAKIGNYNHSI